MKNKTQKTVLKLFRRGSVSDRVYKVFIDTGKVPSRIIRLLALKVMKNKKLNEKETAIFFGITSEVNQMIVVISKKDS